jgi:hypothetical protein
MLKIPLDMEIYRRPHWTDPNDMGDRHNGCFVIPKRSMVIVVSSGEGWEHVSVSVKDRCPVWDEMEWVKRRLWADTDTVMQLHVPPQEHRSLHPYCLHLWRPLNAEIPRPPGAFVAPIELCARPSVQTTP